MKKIVKNFILEFKSIVQISFIFTIFLLINYISKIHTILEINNLEVNLQSGFLYIVSSFANVFIINIIIICFIFALYVLKISFKIKKNYFIYLFTFIFSVFIIIIFYIDLKIYSLLEIHIDNNYIINQIKNVEMLKNDTDISILEVLYILIFVVFLYILSYFINKYIFSKNKKIIRNSKRSYLYINTVSLLIVIVLFIKLNTIILSFPIFNFLNKKPRAIISFKLNYQKIENKINKKTNIIFIVSESLRADVINQENSPNIYNFMQNNDVIRAKYSYSGAHFTMFSIFSILNSIYGYHHNFFNEKEQESNILDFLKKHNYQNILLTASNIEYHGKNKLIKSWDDYKKILLDSELIKKFQVKYKQLQKQNNPYFFFLFFNNTHYSYKFKKDEIKYNPYLQESNLTYLMTDLNQEDKEKIFNRYKNSVINLDNNFQRVINTLSEKDKKEAIIVFTGDHGEQFWEHGSLGHLNKKSYFRENILIPFFIRIPGIKKEVFLTSHLDIFPTVLDYISDINEKQINNLFQGETLLKEDIKDNRYFIISSIYGYWGLGDLYLVNKYGKAVINSLSDKLLEINRFKAVKYLTHEDKIITDKNIIKKLDEDIKNFEKEYKKYIELKGE